jgi:hypothetical protein
VLSKTSLSLVGLLKVPLQLFMFVNPLHFKSFYATMPHDIKIFGKK